MSAVFQGETHYFHKLKNIVTLNEALNCTMKKKPAAENQSLLWGFQRGKRKRVQEFAAAAGRPCPAESRFSGLRVFRVLSAG